MSYDAGYTGHAFQGEKYSGYISAKDIAIHVRKTVKEAQKLGVLPDAAQGFKYSVRSESFSGGQAVRVGITAPDERCWRALNPKDDPQGYYRPVDGVWVNECGMDKTYSAEIRAIGKFLNDLGNDHTRRDVDSQIGYWDVSCWITVTFNGGHCI